MERLSELFQDFDVWRDCPDVVARPPRIVFAFLAAGFGIGLFFETPDLYEPARYLGGSGLCIAGIALMAASLKQLGLARTPVETWRAATAVVVAGPYSRTRNPIYIAMMLLYLGIGVIASAPTVVALAPALFGVLHFGVVRREEDYLECKFGDAYLAYKQAVPRWV